MALSACYFVRVFLLLCGCTTLVYGQDCPDLPQIANGMLSYNPPGGRAQGTVATYTCSSGYFFVQESGSPTRTCGSNGQWSGSPGIACGMPCPVFTVTNGEVMYGIPGEPIPDTRAPGAGSTITCASGYSLVGSGTGTCQSDGTWSNGGTTCQGLCSDLTVPTNGQPITYSAGTSGNRPVNTVATYSCVTGYTLVGSNTRTCQSDVTWSGSEPTCSRICSDLLPITNGMIMYNSGFPRLEGTVATYSCEDGYLFALLSTGNVQRTCGSTGQWSGAPPVCDVPCPVLSVTNGVVQYRIAGGTFIPITTGLVPVNLVATTTCNSGSTLVGLSTRTCQTGGVWSGSETTCQTFDCGDPPELTNGMITFTTTTFGSTATYSCNESYTQTGPSSRTCQANRQWSSAVIACVVLCPRENISNGMASYSMSEDPPPVGTVATYSCDTGYELTGNEMRTCKEKTGWNGTLPNCTIVDCGPLTDPLNGQVDTSSGTTFNQVATYSCDSGYLLTGDSTRTCQSNGVWSSTEPCCEFILFSIGTAYTNNNSAVTITDIGEGFSALTCHTELTTCCREEDNSGTALGQWVGPDSKQIVESNSSSEFYVSREQFSISLNLRGSSTQPGGSYCCVVPRAGGVTRTACVEVTVSRTSVAIHPTVGYPVAIAVILVTSLTVIIILVIIVIVRTRQLQTARTQLSQLYHNKQQVYETPDQVLYEDLSKMDVGGAGDHTHTPVMELSQCPAYAPTEVTTDRGRRGDEGEEHIYES